MAPLNSLLTGRGEGLTMNGLLGSKGENLASPAFEPELGMPAGKDMIYLL